MRALFGPGFVWLAGIMTKALWGNEQRRAGRPGGADKSVSQTPAEVGL